MWRGLSARGSATDNLAVLHNKNRLVHAFSRSGWIQDTLGEVLSRSVTSCAGMTVSGLRRIPQGEEAEDAFDAHILGPLDMLGLIGAATVVGSLMYGVGICWRQCLELHYQPEELETGMDDEKMVQMLKSAGPCSDLPPLALAEIVDLSDDDFIVRRLHLVIVDTWRQKWLVRNNVDQLRSSMRTEAAGPLTRNTTPIRLSAENGRQQHQVSVWLCSGWEHLSVLLHLPNTEDHSLQVERIIGSHSSIPRYPDQVCEASCQEAHCNTGLLPCR